METSSPEFQRKQLMVQIREQQLFIRQLIHRLDLSKSPLLSKLLVTQISQAKAQLDMYRMSLKNLEGDVEQ